MPLTKKQPNPDCPKKSCKGVRRHNLGKGVIECDACGDTFDLSAWVGGEERKT